MGITILTKKGILLAEDDVQLRMLLVAILGGAGYTIFDAEDGEKAIELYEENSDAIGLLLLDLGLPKMTGVEVFKKIRARQPDVKIIAMSGWGKRETVDELYEDGVNMFIQKPYKPAEIIENVKRLLDD